MNVSTSNISLEESVAPLRNIFLPNLYGNRFSRLLSDGNEVFIEWRRRRRGEALGRDCDWRYFVAVEWKGKGQVDRLEASAKLPLHERNTENVRLTNVRLCYFDSEIEAAMP